MALVGVRRLLSLDPAAPVDGHAVDDGEVAACCPQRLYRGSINRTVREWCSRYLGRHHDRPLQALIEGLEVDDGRHSDATCAQHLMHMHFRGETSRALLRDAQVESRSAAADAVDLR